MPDMNSLPAIRPETWPKGGGGAFDEGFDLPVIDKGGVTPIQVALQHKWGILAFALVVSGIVWFALKQLPVRYAATASVMVDTRQPRVSSGDSLLSSQTVEPDLLRTRMEALRSPRLVREVVQQLNLTSVPEFCETSPSLTEAAENLVKKLAGRTAAAPAAPGCVASVQAVADKLASFMSFSADGHSFYILVSAEAADPDLAAKIANTYVAIFIAQQRRNQVGLTEQADAWLSTHNAELKAEVLAADDAVQRQRQGGHLTTMRGETLLGQSLSELNTQLIVATSDLAQKRSTLSSLEGVARSGPNSLDASAPVLASPIIQKLLDRESALAAAQAEMSTRLGSANSEVIANAAQLERIRQQIRTEVNKAVVSLRGEVQALESRRAGLAANVQSLQAQLGNQGNSAIRLSDLERDAASARSRYDAAAVRLEQIRIEAATQRADVQPLIEAVPPKVPSFPRTRMVVTGTFMASLGLGAGLAFAFAMMSNVFSDLGQVERQTGVYVLGLFPKPLRRRNKPQDLVIDNPTSREAEALQAVFSNLIGNRSHSDARLGWALMITSALPGEGKTSFSVALGRAAASRGLSVVVVDCDLRRSTMHALFSGGLERPLPGDVSDSSEPGSNEPGRSASNFAELALERSTGMRVLIAPPASRNPHALLSSADLPRALKQLRANHDVVIIDTPPVLAVPDAINLAALADDVVMLVDWSRTRRSALLAALKALRRTRIQVTGIVLSKVDLQHFARKNKQESHYAMLHSSYYNARS